MTLTGSSNIGAFNFAPNSPGDAVILAPGSYMSASQFVANSSGVQITINGGQVLTSLIYDAQGASGQFVLNSGTLVNTANNVLFADGENYGFTPATEMAVEIGGGGGTINTNGFTTISQRPLMNVTGSPSAGTLTVTGAGSLNLSGSGTYTGTTLINGGTVKISQDGNLGIAPASLGWADQVEISSGTLNFSSMLTGITLTSGSGNSTTTTSDLVGLGNVTGGLIGMNEGFTQLLGGTGAIGGAGVANGTNTLTAISAPPPYPVALKRQPM